jgi:thioredoxin reductase (NADPH)
MKKMREQAKELGVEIVNDEVVSVEGKDGEWRVISASGEGYSCKKILIASGTRRKELGVNGEHKYVGRGLSYCATCDAAFYNGKTVAVVGGSNAALSSALLLSEIADRVYLIYRGEKFVKAEQAWVKMAKKNKKIEFMLGEEIVGIEGEEKVKGVVLKSGKKVKVDGIFVDIGAVPENGLAKGIGVKLDREGYVIIDDAGRTNLKGVYAAGDVTNRELKQIITACAQGSIAAYSIYKDNL